MDAEFQGLIDGSLSVNAQLATYLADIRDIEKEAKDQDEEILGTTVHVSAFVNHGDKTQSSASSAFTANNSSDAAYNSSLYGSGDMTSGDDAVVDSILSQITSLSDVVVFTFELSHEVISFIIEELGKHSPYKTGRYMHSHVVFADGVLMDDFNNLTDFSNGPVATNTNEFLFVNTLPYSRKIEAGESSMAPSGVYEVVAHEAQDKYGSTCIVEFVDYAGVYGVMSEATNASYGRRTRTHLNKAQNRFPAIRLTFPNR